jgi:hypothetical protein
MHCHRSKRARESPHYKRTFKLKGAQSSGALEQRGVGREVDSMKTELFRITMAGTLALGLMAATETARAQQPLVVNIPFAFAAGRMALPAGEYRIQKVAYDSSILLIERTDHAAGTVVMSLAAQANAKQAQSKLVFHRYDNRYFLSQIWIAGSVRGRELTKSPQEKEQSSAAHNEMPDQVTIVARLLAPKP